MRGLQTLTDFGIPFQKFSGMCLAKEKKIQQTAENGKNQNKEYPGQLIRFFIPAGDDVYGNNHADQTEKYADDRGSAASDENGKNQYGKLQKDQQAKKEPSA